MIIGGGENDFALGRPAASVGNCQVGIAVGSANVRREDPQGLRLVIPGDCAAASSLGVGACAAQHAAVNRFADNRFAAHHAAAAAIDDVAADLSRCAIGGCSCVIEVLRSLGVRDFEIGRQSPEACG